MATKAGSIGVPWLGCYYLYIPSRFIPSDQVKSFDRLQLRKQLAKEDLRSWCMLTPPDLFLWVYIYIYMKFHEGSFSIMHARICFFLFFHCHLLTLLKNLNGPVQFSVAIAALATRKEPIKLATWAWSPWNQLYALQSPPPLINI